MVLASFTACGSSKSDEPDKTLVDSEISVVSREDGSGTRGAFIELFGVEEKDANGEKVDNTTDEATITNSTSVMMTTVAGDTNAIGYISLGSLDDSVKAVKIDGVAPSVETVKDGSYKISRPFNIATKDNLSDVAKDFASFILSTEGQQVIQDNHYIAVGNPVAYAGTKPAGKIVVAGSSSVTPVMEKLKEAYLAINPNATIEIQESDSTTGMTSAIDGICDIGMASRELKDSELGAGLKPTVIAMDGIAVIVNKGSEVNELTSDQVKQIYIGEITSWAELLK
ncbi:substrate-binding domain-containing protein [Clostridium aminobutyricum]|uniref:Substrate-binding domain-containing protein n=2 Tax=Clostridium aminobutyricum TaxID=33953 RepID=A0A939D819_CLOAM|nr:substrate-binding domain-containing protein [Clostridium aminobutyricum]MBN7773134.1 substrate-binding domain-containing protein [Clostridium aminobutyricum]